MVGFLARLRISHASHPVLRLLHLSFLETLLFASFTLVVWKNAKVGYVGSQPFWQVLNGVFLPARRMDSPTRSFPGAPVPSGLSSRAPFSKSPSAGGGKGRPGGTLLRVLKALLMSTFIPHSLRASSLTVPSKLSPWTPMDVLMTFTSSRRSTKLPGTTSG